VARIRCTAVKDRKKRGQTQVCHDLEKPAEKRKRLESRGKEGLECAGGKYRYKLPGGRRTVAASRRGVRKWLTRRNKSIRGLPLNKEGEGGTGTSREDGQNSEKGRKENDCQLHGSSLLRKGMGQTERCARGHDHPISLERRSRGLKKRRGEGKNESRRSNCQSPPPPTPPPPHPPHPTTPKNHPPPPPPNKTQTTQNPQKTTPTKNQKTNHQQKQPPQPPPHPKHLRFVVCCFCCGLVMFYELLGVFVGWGG